MAVFLASTSLLAVKGAAKRRGGAGFFNERNAGFSSCSSSSGTGLSWCSGRAVFSLPLNRSEAGSSHARERSNGNGAGFSLWGGACFSNEMSSRNASMTSGGGTSVSLSDSESQPGGATRRFQRRVRGETLIVKQLKLNFCCYALSYYACPVQHEADWISLNRLDASTNGIYAI